MGVKTFGSGSKGPIDSSNEREQVVSVAELVGWTKVVFTMLGLSEKHANLVADTLVQADLRGVHSHGVQRVPVYAAQIQEGNTVADAEPEVVHRTATTAVVDAHQAMGQVAAHAGMELAVESAIRTGQGSVAIRNSTHCGALAYFAMMAPVAGCIGFAVTNAGMNMMPWGGKAKLVGNNPLAYAVPTPEAFPLVLDMATSVVAGGKLDIAILRGESIPEGWALGPDGQPTTDPATGRDGSLLPIGGPKGYGLAVLLDVLSGVLAGGRFGQGLGMSGASHFVQALRIDAFSPADDFLKRMGALIDQIHDCPTVPGVDRIYVPGEIEHDLSEVRLKEGIPLPVNLTKELAILSKTLGISTLRTDFSASPGTS